jgi:hypothetical protein
MKIVKAALESMLLALGYRPALTETEHKRRAWARWAK